MRGELVPLVPIDGASKQAERELMARRRHSGEPLKEYYEDIQFLMMAAYPGQRGSVRSLAGLDAFITGLRDSELSREVKSTAPSTLAEAYRRTIEIEREKSIRDMEEGRSHAESRRQRSLQHFLGKGKKKAPGAEELDDEMSARTRALRFADT